MIEHWKIAGAGALGGAMLAVAIVFSAAQLGWLPARVNEDAIHDYLLSHPQILVEMDQALQVQAFNSQLQKQQAAVDKLGLKPFFDPRIAFIVGPENAKNTVIEFFDYNCPICRASAPVLEKFFNKHQADTRFAFIEFPIRGPDSEASARVTLAARNQRDKYMGLHFALMKHEGVVGEATAYETTQKMGFDFSRVLADMKNPAIEDTIKGAYALARNAHFDGTPYYIVNGKVVPGALKDGQIEALLKN